MVKKGFGISLHREAAVTAGSMAAMHAHDTHELYFLLAGRRRYFVGHTIYDVDPGNLVLIPKGHLHRTTAPGQDGYERYVLNFSPGEHRAIPLLLGQTEFDGLMQRGCLQLPAAAAAQIRKDLELLEQELSCPSAGARAYTAHLLQDILITALRCGSRKAPLHGDSADKIQQVARYISQSYQEPLTLEQAAQMACMEKTYFSKRFKHLTGFGFHEYLTQTRLAAAQQLLENSGLSINEIAERCGFSGGNYFGDVFLRVKGCSPCDHRRIHRKAP